MYPDKLQIIAIVEESITHAIAQIHCDLCVIHWNQAWKGIKSFNGTSYTYGVFFSTKKCAFKKKCNYVFFLKIFRPIKGWYVLFWIICMVEGIAFYAQYQSRVLIISCKEDDFCLFIGPPDAIVIKVAWYRYPVLKLIFFIVFLE